MSETSACLKEIYDEVLVNLPGATVAALEIQTKAVMREFYTVSAAWRIELDPITLYPGKSTYYLDPPLPNAEVLYIHDIWYRIGGSWRRMAKLNQTVFRDRINRASEGGPSCFKGFADMPGKFEVSPTLSTGAEAITEFMIPVVSLIMKEPWDKRVPLFVTRYWKDVIIDGVLSRMYRQQDKPFSNTQMSQYHERRFRSGCHRAREMAKRQYTDAENTVHFPRFA